MATTTRGYVTPDDTDAPEIPADMAALAESVDGDVQALVDTYLENARSTISQTSNTPLSSSINTPALIMTRSFAFEAGQAYRISVWARVSLTNATSTSGWPYVQIRRTNASGTLIHDPGAQGLAGQTGFTSTGVQSCIVKCTAADTTQTIAFCASWSGASATAINVASATSARPYLLIEPIGPAANFADAMEIPTA